MTCSGIIGITSGINPGVTPEINKLNPLGKFPDYRFIFCEIDI